MFQIQYQGMNIISCSAKFETPTVIKTIEVYEQEIVSTSVPTTSANKAPSKGLKLARKKKGQEDEY